VTAACNTCRELLGGYVLGALDPAEAHEVRRHMETCPECAREHDDLAPLPAALDAVGNPDVGLERPPAALEEAVLDRFAREKGPAASRARRARRRRPRLRRVFARPLPAALGGVAIGAIAASAVLALTGSSSDPGPREFGARLTGSQASTAAYAKLSAAGPAGTRVRLTVHGLPAVRGEVYELWCVGEGRTRWSAGTFRVDGRGTAEVELTTAARLGEYHRLSVERKRPGAARGQRVLAGEIVY
jgi:hypothetical protein